MTHTAECNLVQAGNPVTWHPIARHHRPAAAHTTPSPAAASRIFAAISRTLASAVKAWHQHRKNRENRAAVERMLALEPHILDDIGITRDDLQLVLALPVSVNAAAELETIALGRKKQGKRRYRN